MIALLQVRDVEKHFGGIRALQGISLDVDSGDIVGLIGPNGAGKTTLFNVISGLIEADKGQIRLAGKDIIRLPAHRRAALGIARSFQNLGLVQEDSAHTNVLTALHRSAPYRARDLLLRPRWVAEGERQLRMRATEALAMFHLEHTSDEPVAALSFAAARFVELAAVAADAPRMMLLDEPTTGLDLSEIALLKSVLLRLRDEGTTILVVAHDVGFVMSLCDYIYVLAEGGLLFEGSPDEVRSSPAVVEAYLGSAT